MQFVLILCGALVFAGIIAIIIVLNQSNRNRYADDPPIPDTSGASDLKRKVTSMKRLLKPWASRRSHDLTFNMEYRYILSTKDMITGKLFVGGEPVIAFHCVMDNGNDILAATSTENELLFTIDKAKIAVQYNGAPLGEIHAGGTLSGTDGLTIGHAKRSGESGTSYPFFSYETPLATIQTYSRIYDLQQDEVIRMHDDGKILQLHASPTETNEKWLLALAILEATYYRFAFGEKTGKTVYGGRWKAMQ